MAGLIKPAGPPAQSPRNDVHLPPDPGQGIEIPGFEPPCLLVIVRIQQRRASDYASTRLIEQSPRSQELLPEAGKIAAMILANPFAFFFHAGMVQRQNQTGHLCVTYGLSPTRLPDREENGPPEVDGPGIILYVLRIRA